VNDLSKAPSTSIQNLNENESFYGTLCHSGPFIITDLRAQIYNTAPDMMYCSIFVLGGILGSSLCQRRKISRNRFSQKKDEAYGWNCILSIFMHLAQLSAPTVRR
jgi:ribosome biogenesis SPOUT family RNA methylase Rps3